MQVNRRILYTPVLATGSVVNNIALNGTPVTGSGVTASTTFTSSGLTTTQSNTVWVCFCRRFANGSGITSVTSPNLTWTQRASASDGGNHTMFEYSAVAAGPLTAEVVTANWAGTAPADGSIIVFALSGANTSTIYDANGLLPATTNTSADVFLTTSNANDICFASYIDGTGTGTAGTGWLSIASVNFMMAEYKLVTSLQSSMDASTTGVSVIVGIGDAIVST